MRQLSGQDATFIFMEDRAAPLHLTSLYIYDPSTAPGGKVRHKQILAHIQSRLHSSKVFTQKLLHVPMNLDYPYWVDDPGFDLEFHVRHIGLPKPGTGANFVFYWHACIRRAWICPVPLGRCISSKAWTMWKVYPMDASRCCPNITTQQLMVPQERKSSAACTI